MNSVRSQLKHYLGKLPGITIFLNLLYFLNRSKKRFSSSHIDKPKTLSIAKVCQYSVPKRHTFFGYYDKSPFSKNNEYLLAIVTPSANNSPYKLNEAQIGYFANHKKDNFNLVSSTTTWCWQQGCRLQWYPPDDNSLIIYNSLVDNDYGSIVQDVFTKKIIEKYNSPVYDVCNNGRWALSLNFSRLHRLRPGYGYANFEDKTSNQLHPSDDGIWLIDLFNKQKKLIVSLKQIMNFDLAKNIVDAAHHINHLSFNPSGNRFLFLHLIWDNFGRRFQSLITSNLDGSDLYVLPLEENISHYTWKTDTEILVTTSEDRYLTWVDKTGSLKGEFSFLKKDGHPSYSPSQGYLITDTTPDKYLERQLLLVDLNEKKLHQIVRHSTPAKYRGEFRCDFHPRWDRKNEKVCFDSAHKGFRSMYVFDVLKFLDDCLGL